MLSTTAAALLLSTPVFAEAHSQMAFEYNASEDFYASDLIGKRVYSTDQNVAGGTVAQGSEAQWNDIGEINDLIVSNDAKVDAVIVGVGGFLGIGEKDVALTMDQIEIVAQTDNPENRYLVVNMTKEQLDKLPTFDRSANAMATNTTAQPAQNQAADANANANANTNATQKPADQKAADASNMDKPADQKTADVNANANATQKPADQKTADANANANATQKPADQKTADANANANATQKPADQKTADANANANATQQPANQTAANANANATAPADRPLLTQPNVQREGFTNTTVAELSTDDLDGAYVYGPDDQTVGEIGKLLLTDSGEIDRAVINVGGFLGLGEKPVAVTFNELQLLRNNNGELRVYIDSTEENLKAQPEYQG
jgi:hypothetical protein